MRRMDAARWDDYVLAALLLLISVPRVVLALLYDHPLGAEGTISIFLVVCALAIVIPCPAAAANSLRHPHRANCPVRSAADLHIARRAARVASPALTPGGIALELPAGAEQRRRKDSYDCTAPPGRNRPDQ